ncbi:RNA polymerase sigma factor [Alkalicoccobacillus porphyridii]|uniref:RNA polymerase sigma factor n=1 Tax=Alkalicoccobacillus porphyridii TaxID=2597270 RepID=A0A553ZT29_9BACI|nr:RNA polymerase sigma factor [Alkalicoccobacillus porphyridii]TSB44622.1 RNA polymerase sigma factor [Alkalicoccobacillus porphyridii]
MRPLVKETPVINEKDDFEAIVSPYMPVLKSHCTYVTRSKWDGEDLMQDVLVRLYNHWCKHQQPLAKSYVLRAATNTWIDRLRQKKPNELLTEETIEKNTLRSSHHSEVLDSAVQRLLNTCSPKQRTVLLLIEAFGFTAKETADVLGETEGSVKASLHRARKSIKNKTIDASVDVEDELVSIYSHAIQQGHVDTFIQLYNQDIQGVLAETNVRSAPNDHTVQVIGRINSGYILVSVQLKTGKKLFIPVYQLSTSAVLNTAYTNAA